MTRILSLSSSSAYVSSLWLGTLKACRSALPLFEAMPQIWSQCLPPRLRYDMGELDINPDMVRRRGSSGESPDASCEMMRRAY